MKNFFVCITIIVFSGCATLPEQYIALNERKTLNLDEVLKQIENESVLFLGEAHTSSSDHLFQLEVIKHLHENGGKVAIALELFPSEKQRILNGWITGSLAEYEFEMECQKVWNMLYWYYGEIFRYARENGIPLFGISFERTLINNVAINGLSVVPEGKLKEIKFESCREDLLYEKLMKSAEAKGIHERNLPFFCDAQRLKDEVMAYNIAKLLKKNDYAVVVLLGAAHASRIAVPKMLQKYLRVNYKVLMPANFQDMTGEDMDNNTSDYVWF